MPDGDGRLAEVLEWMTAYLEQAHTLESLAGRAAMSRRNFTRHFRQVTGTPLTADSLAEELPSAIAQGPISR